MAPFAYVIALFVTNALYIKARVFVGSKPFQTRLVLASKAGIFGGLLALPANIKLGTNALAYLTREKKMFCNVFTRWAGLGGRSGGSTTRSVWEKIF